jgi:hypothetical protein
MVELTGSAGQLMGSQCELHTGYAVITGMLSPSPYEIQTFN